MSLKDFFSSKRAAASDASGGAAAGEPAAGEAGNGGAAGSGAAAAAAAPAATGTGTTTGTGTGATGTTGTTGTGSTAAPASANANAPTNASTNANPTTPNATPPVSPLSGFTGQIPAAPTGGSTDALNSQIVQSVQMSNSETAAYASSQIAIAPNMMITQASGLVAQSAANYFDGASKLALASKSVLLKNMTEKLVKEDLKGAAEDALGVLITDLLVGTAAAVAAAAGAIEGEAAHFALDKIDQSINKYKSLVDRS
ncbi:MAG TPA: hypothetical protein VNE00_15500 [Paraburkholderia sp.]|nr:hypothetical protein [Paraburkholderia sp.]